MKAKVHDPREINRLARHRRIRRRLSGTPQRPRLCVHRSLKNFYAQIIDDVSGKVILGLSTRNKDVQQKIKAGGNVEGATVLGRELAAKAKGQGIVKICFDRGGYRYHGRVKAFAEAAREGGLEF